MAIGLKRKRITRRTTGKRRMKLRDLLRKGFITGRDLKELATDEFNKLKEALRHKNIKLWLETPSGLTEVHEITKRKGRIFITLQRKGGLAWNLAVIEVEVLRRHGYKAGLLEDRGDVDKAFIEIELRNNDRLYIKGTTPTFP